MTNTPSPLLVVGRSPRDPAEISGTTTLTELLRLANESLPIRDVLAQVESGDSITFRRIGYLQVEFISSDNPLPSPSEDEVVESTIPSEREQVKKKSED